MKIDKKYKILLIIIIIILSITLLTLTLKNRKLTLIESTIKDTILFTEKIVYTPINYIKEKINNIGSKEEYIKLKEKTSDYDALKIELEEAKKTIQDLKKTLELNTTLNEYQKINATIITRDVSGWYQFITIDKGSNDGVTVGDAVINSYGLIGSVSKVSKKNSTVKLLTGEYNNKISVKINNAIYGLIVNYKDNYLIVEGIAENTTIEKGNSVSTTGLGNNFPSGIMVGTVEEITTDNFDLAKTLLVKPNVDFNDLNYVTVVKKGV